MSNPPRRVNRKEVLKLHGNRCKFCGKSGEKVPLDMAHYLANSKGGNERIPLCPTCHRRYDTGRATPSELKKINITKEEYEEFLPKGRKVVTPEKPIRKHYRCTVPQDKIRPCKYRFNSPKKAGVECLTFTDGKKCLHLSVQ